MSYLKNFSTKISPTERGFLVTYSDGPYSGTVEYAKYEMSNLMMKGKPVYLMVRADMGDVIEGIHQESPLSSEDFNSLNMEIRTHSRNLIDQLIG